METELDCYTQTPGADELVCAGEKLIEDAQP
jgi:hypothetical protein